MKTTLSLLNKPISTKRSDGKYILMHPYTPRIINPPVAPVGLVYDASVPAIFEKLRPGTIDGMGEGPVAMHDHIYGGGDRRFCREEADAFLLALLILHCPSRVHEYIAEFQAVRIGAGSH